MDILPLAVAGSPISCHLPPSEAPGIYKTQEATQQDPAACLPSMQNATLNRLCQRLPINMFSRNLTRTSDHRTQGNKTESNGSTQQSS